MLKVHILDVCSHCNGEAYSSTSEVEDSQGRGSCFASSCIE
jgi:hypothetical protein